MAQVGIIIPTLNEAPRLPGILADLHDLDVPTDIVVADGGSTDDTLSVAVREGARTTIARRGRAFQLNAGAAEAEGEWLCFLHADVRVPQAARRELRHAVCDPATHAAVWGLAIDAPDRWARVMELGAYLRDRLGGLPYGDQGLIVRRELFDAVGGYPTIPVMEDVAMVRALGRRTRVRRLGARLEVSPRRWLREGPYRTWVRNSLLLAAYLAGISPRHLARWYHAEVA